MEFCNLHTVSGDNISLHVSEGKIISPEKTKATTTRKILFDDCLVFPGLINSHDHLEFNCFPLLANRIYNNYTEWGLDIHKTNRNEIDAVLKIPFALRWRWGIYKNLLAGVTTVANHGKHYSMQDVPIEIIHKPQSLHSAAFEKRWFWKLNDPTKRRKPVVMHTGEGTDAMAEKEIQQVIQSNFLKRKIIGVHGVSMTTEQAKKIVALVWCPDSNFRLLNQTAAVSTLQNHTEILFGTDSTLTADWNIWKHLRLARKTNLLSDTVLYKAMTSTAAKVWETGNKNDLSPGDDASFVITKRNNKKGFDAFYETDPNDIFLVMHKGKILLFDELIAMHIREFITIQNFQPVIIGNNVKYVIGNMIKLAEEIKIYYPIANFPFKLP